MTCNLVCGLWECGLPLVSAVLPVRVAVTILLTSYMCVCVLMKGTTHKNCVVPNQTTAGRQMARKLCCIQTDNLWWTNAEDLDTHP